MGQEKLILLNLSQKEKERLEKSFRDLVYFLGECEYKERAFWDSSLLGQNWISLDNIDYVPSQVINNKVKPLINKQARFMLSRPPSLLFNPINTEDKEKTEALRQFIDDIFETDDFWSEAMKAFKLSTIVSKVMMRIEANPDRPIKIHWHGPNDFKYKLDPTDKNKLSKIVIISQDSATASLSYDKQLWYRYTYEMKQSVVNPESNTCYLTTEVFAGSNLGTPIKVATQDTLLDKIPCWVIHNEKDIFNPHGQSDIKDLRPLQDQLNRKLSDFADSLRFQMFAQDVFIDATEDSVNSSRIAPNAIIALKSIDAANGQKATHTKAETSFSSVNPIQYYLQYLDDEMHDKLSIPKPADLKNVPSGKSMKYLYVELMARCDEKWIDWEPAIKQLIKLIIDSCIKFNCYENWDQLWNELDFVIALKKNYPIPEDESDKKRLAIEEVTANVRSHRSYIKEFGDEEDIENEIKEICEDLALIAAAQMEQFNIGTEDPNTEDNTNNPGE